MRTRPDADDVRAEHLAEVNQAAQWAYLAGLLIVGTLLMLALIALLGESPV
jgi:hypothetical protein